jgi:hypothetical protein
MTVGQTIIAIVIGHMVLDVVIAVVIIRTAFSGKAMHDVIELAKKAR